MDPVALPSTLDIRKLAKDSPDAVAVVIDGAPYTFGDLARRVDRAVGRLGRGPGALICRPQLEHLVQFYAALAAQTPTLLLHPRWTDAQMLEAMDRVGASVLADGADVTHVLTAEARDIHPQATLLLGTSGTTGSMKIVQHSTASLLSSALASARNIPFRSDDRWLMSLPYAHVGGAMILVRCLIARLPIVLSSGSFADRSFVDRVDALGATLYSLVPTQLHDLVRLRTRAPDVAPNLRLALVGGAPAALSLRLAAHRRAIPAIYTYGLTEAGSQVSTQNPAEASQPPQSADVGRPLPDMEVALSHDGRLSIRGPQLMIGYLGEAPLAERDGGWFTTSDRVKVLADGRLCILGRVDDVVISGGENIDPLAVEQILSDCAHLSEVAVLGLADPRWGQKLVAIVVLESTEVLSPGDEGRLLREVHTFAREQLPSYAVPKHYFSAPGLPKLGIGKLDRKRLPDFWAELSADGRAGWGPV